ncbi:MAG: hypothetical protein KBD01_17515 [Acidobacteria bacterium]|nr:hypothetical protein [Acidobacteriota bacterium]
MRLPALHRIVLVLLALAPGGSLFAAEPIPGLPEPVRPVHEVGQALEADGAGLLPADAVRQPSQLGEKAAPGRIWAVVHVRWEQVPTVPAGYDLAPLRSLLDELKRRGQPVALAIHGGHPAHGRWGAGGPELPPGADLGSYRRAWLGFLRQVARASQSRAAWYVLHDFLPLPGSPDDLRAAQYEIKSASIALRAEDLSAGVAVAGGDPLLALLERAYRETGDLAPYLDGISVAGMPHAETVAAVGRLRTALFELDPAATIVAEPAPGADAVADPGAELAARTLELLDAGADLVAQRFPDAAAAPTVVRLGRALGPTLGIVPRSTAGVEVESSAVPVRWSYLFDDEQFREVIAFWAAQEPPPGADVSLLLDSNLRRDFLLVDPAGLNLVPPVTEPAGERRVRFTAPLFRRPLLLMIQREKTSPRVGIETETAEARGKQQVSAEEIIAAHQRWRAFQDERLATVRRDGEIGIRVRVAQVTGTFELTIRAGYFWERGLGAEWVIRENLFNGVRLNWDKIPELPFLSQERVVQPPLELNLDKRYRYELEDVEEVEGHSCWRLAFEPLDENVSLHRGRAWIDRRTAALVRVRTTQTRLSPPLISDEETQTFRPHEGPDGTTYWLLDDIDGQQIYTVGGSNLVVLRRTTFGAPLINDAGFEPARAEVRASDRQMLRDTEDGLKWYSKTDGGERRVLEKGDPRQLFAVGGVLKNPDRGALPLAGINYTDIDLFGRDILFNVFFAGVLANVGISDPTFLGTRLDVGANVNLIGVSSTDRQYEQGEEIESQNVDRLTQSLRVSAGYPLGNFVKLRGVFEASYNNYMRADDTENFRVPSGHVLTEGTLQLAFDRRGWGLMLQGAQASRSKWEAWGPEAAGSGGKTVLADVDPERAKTYSWWSAGLQKAFFLPLFQKIEIGARYQAGRDLDRFSAFTFGFPGGSRLRGFGGAGIRFDRGAIGELSYSFNLREAIRFDATLEHANVHDPRLAEGNTNHTGVGIAANFLGPWRTIIRLDVGRALKSDLEAVEGDTEVYLVFLRLF